MFVFPLGAPGGCSGPVVCGGNSRKCAQCTDVDCPMLSLPASSHQPQTPHLEEDLKEVLRSEAGIELIIEDDVKPEKQKRKQGVSWFNIQYLLVGCPVLLRGVFAG